MENGHKSKMILVINICKESLHYLEFVRPIECILKENNIKFMVKHYLDIANKDIDNSDKIIICGTSLADNKFLSEISKFKFLLAFNRPVLGICGGMQIISLVFGGKIKNNAEIGFYNEEFTGKFLGIDGKKEVYHLHNNYATLPDYFLSYTTSKIPQAIKHKTKPVYGVLFHPEVRNKEMIVNFANLSLTKKY